jgi:hypothetical protein
MGPIIALLLSTDFSSLDWEMRITYSLGIPREQNDTQRFGLN